jgi:hypothetical protein
MVGFQVGRAAVPQLKYDGASQKQRDQQADEGYNERRSADGGDTGRDRGGQWQ